MRSVTFTEPTGNVPPKLSGSKYDGGKIFIFGVNTTVYMNCEIVGYPIPKYRCYIFGQIACAFSLSFGACWFVYAVRKRYFPITEPTNNVPPKKVGAEFGGWRVLNVKLADVAWLTCQVTGYPVPRFK